MGGGFSDAKCFAIHNAQHLMLDNQAARRNARRLAITAGPPR
ncbi:hypothetical protein BN132_2366 [Cronobacter turicensis 564]|nr:hypothetical protein BN132_2366 [Cronobacter turicensis 564]